MGGRGWMDAPLRSETLTESTIRELIKRFTSVLLEIKDICAESGVL